MHNTKKVKLSQDSFFIYKGTKLKNETCIGWVSQISHLCLLLPTLVSQVPFMRKCNNLVALD